jgi:hypothetical protein
MNNVISGVWPGGEGPFPGQRPTPVTDELNRIVALLREALPGDVAVSFSFDGKLLVHIDLPRREDVISIEALLPKLDGGLFHNLSRSATPHRRFSHRVSALVSS